MTEIIIAGAAIAVLALILWGRRPDRRGRVRCHSCGKFVAWGEHIPLAVAAPHIWADYCPDCAAHLLAGGEQGIEAGGEMKFETINNQLCRMVEPEPEPEPEPKPLLADAKVGDLCKRRDGRFVLLSNVPPDSLYWEVGNNLYYQDGRESLDEERDVDIVYTEPLAPEGSAEWAWQMLILQKPVSHPAEGILLDTYYSKDGFVRCMAKTGWQLYEPEPKPEPKPEHPAINGYNRYDYIPVEGIRQPKPNPEPSFAVGDWAKYDIDSYLRVIETPGRERTLCKTLSGVIVYPYTSCLTKVSPSEVVLDFGNGIKGRVCMPYPERGLSVLNDNNHWIAQIDPDALDAPMRKLVESLLKAQEWE